MLRHRRSSGLSQVSLRPASNLVRFRVEDQPLSRWVSRFSTGLPDISGDPIRLEALPCLRAYRGKLLSGDTRSRGDAVHAASFLRERRIVFEHDLLHDGATLRSILIHEVFHFVWWRLGNPARFSYEDLIRKEIRIGVKGELGESSAVAKSRLQPGDCQAATRRWKNYVCESFCDTAAWFYGDRTITTHVTLPSRRISTRELWLERQTGLRG